MPVERKPVEHFQYRHAQSHPVAASLSTALSLRLDQAQRLAASLPLSTALSLRLDQAQHLAASLPLSTALSLRLDQAQHLAASLPLPSAPFRSARVRLAARAVRHAEDARGLLGPAL
jgi:hypothetical protein